MSGETQTLLVDQVSVQDLPEAEMPVLEPLFMRLPAMHEVVHHRGIIEHFRIKRVIMLKLGRVLVVSIENPLIVSLVRDGQLLRGVRSISNMDTPRQEFPGASKEA
jgi:hypothetical protein